MIKGIVMAHVQWVNCLQNNIFIDLPPSPLLCEISKAVYLAQQMLWQTGRQAGWQTKFR